MKNEYEIIGKIVKEILLGEMREYLDQDLLSYLLMEEYQRIFHNGAPVEEIQRYESAMQIVGKPIII